MEQKTENKYIKIVETRSTEKTKFFEVINKAEDYLIGEIEWYGAWRQYCFFPYEDMVFNSTCLDLINDTLKEINIKHCSNWKQKIQEEK